MNEQEINIAIARANGWKFVPSHDVCGKSVPDRWDHEEFPSVWADYPYRYTNDLNAMHQVWCTLSARQHQTYRTILQGIITEAIDLDKPKDGPTHSVCQATALQRAEAYLRTLNLWKIQTSPTNLVRL